MSELDRIGWFVVGCTLLAILLVLMFGGGCAHAPDPPRAVMVPHICAPTNDSPAFQKCAADCPNGDAVIWENASNTHCICRKMPEGI